MPFSFCLNAGSFITSSYHAFVALNHCDPLSELLDPEIKRFWPTLNLQTSGLSCLKVHCKLRSKDP